jgi:Protein of unknown function (DUF2637)
MKIRRKRRHGGEEQALAPDWRAEQEQRNRELPERAELGRLHRAQKADKLKASPVTGLVPGSLRVPRAGALWAIAALVLASAGVSFAESYRGLFLWAHHHGLAGPWAAIWPLQVDVFIAVGELALFVALADRWSTRSRVGAWVVTLAGLTVSVAGNVGHVSGHSVADHATAAVPPLAAAAALAVGLGVLKRVIEAHHARASVPVPGTIPADVMAAAKASMQATVAAGNPLSLNQLAERFALTRAQATKLRNAVLAETNGNGAVHHPDTNPPDTLPSAT